jgi:hypothetical protein
MSNTDPESLAKPANVPEPTGGLVLLGPRGGRSAGYDELLARISGAVKPTDIFEEIWVHDIVDLVWEAFRLRRLKANLMTATAHKGLEEALKPFVRNYLTRQELAQAWAARKKEAIEQVDKFLASAGLTMDAVMAQTLSININDIERIDRMIAAAEVRRGAILREVELHRATWGQDLCRAVQQVEKGEFKLIEAQPPETRTAA